MDWRAALNYARPEAIVSLVNAYPEFLECYRDVIAFRKEPKELINMYSEALAILDHNTVEYMCEEMQKTINEQADTIARQEELIASMQKKLEELENR